MSTRLRVVDVLAAAMLLGLGASGCDTVGQVQPDPTDGLVSGETDAGGDTKPSDPGGDQVADPGAEPDVASDDGGGKTDVVTDPGPDPGEDTTDGGDGDVATDEGGGDVSRVCTEDSDCDHSGDKECWTKTVCSEGHCVQVEAEAFDPCDDGDPCTFFAYCQPAPADPPGLTCVADLKQDCDDGNACTTDSCDPETYACRHEVAPTPCLGPSECEDLCDDGVVCNGTWTCTGGECVPTEQTCDTSADKGCVRNICDTGLDQCVYGPSDGDCDDGDPCTADSCDEASGGCTHEQICGNNGPCQVSDGPGCDDETIEACVCAIDDLCCDVAWDGVCVQLAGSSCGADCGSVDAPSCEDLCGSTPDGFCWCSPDCFEYGDCCDDICAFCGGPGCP